MYGQPSVFHYLFSFQTTSCGCFVVVVEALLAFFFTGLYVIFCALFNSGVLIFSFTYICLKKGCLRF